MRLPAVYNVTVDQLLSDTAARAARYLSGIAGACELGVLSLLTASPHRRSFVNTAPGK
jgi:hypothetical protein